MLFSQRNNPKDIELLPYDGYLSERLRIQIHHFLNSVYKVYSNGSDLFSKAHTSPEVEKVFKEINTHICAEHGLFNFSQAPGLIRHHYNPINASQDFIRMCEVGDWVVDILELLVRSSLILGLSDQQDIEKLNHRFRENGVGLEFVEDRFVKINSTILHIEAVKPALILMHSTGFSGPLDEYLEAHEQYRNGDNKAAITSAAKAFESTMKTICQAKGWSTGKGTAVALIKTLFDNQFLPNYYQTQLNSLRTTLEGLPIVRNNNTGHGQGANVINTPDYLTQYALNLAGANITLLIQIYNEAQK